MAIQFIPLIAAIVGGAATVGAGTYAYKTYQQEPEKPAALSQPLVKPELAPVVEKPAIKIAQPILPEFQILRVEPDGSVLIAGTAQAKSKVEILHATAVLANTQAAKNGDFVIVFDNPLKPGAYELYIRSTLGDEILLSAEAGIINVPKQGEEVIAMVVEPGEAAKLIQIPVPKPVAPEIKPIITAKVPVKKEILVAVAKPAILSPVLLGAVEVEGNQLFIAGTGEPGHIVNLYVDDNFVGDTTVSAKGAFLLESESMLEFGNHIVRADMLAKKNAVVIARAQVPLIHDAPMVATVKTKPLIVAKADQPKVTRSRATPKPKRVLRTGSSVIIRKGDNLWRVSRRVLGRGIRYSTIYNANKTQIKNPSLIFPGQIFKVPEKMANTSDTQEG